MIIYIGVDLHYKQVTFHMITRHDDGSLSRKNGTVATDQLKEKFIPLLTKDTHVCVEATGTTYTFVDMIEEYVKKVYVVNPQDFKEIYCSGKKTDRIDAKKLANRVKTHIEDNDPDDGFPIIYIPDKEARKLRRLFSTYEFINKQIVGVKNRISSFFRANLAPVPKFTLSCNVIEIARKYGFDDSEIFQLSILADELSKLQTYKKSIQNEISILGRKRFPHEMEILLSISGISEFTACAIMADVVDIKRFKNHKKFASYMRSAPRVSSSDSVTHIGKIDKKGRKLSFKYMVQGVTHYRKTNPLLRDFYHRKSNGKSKGKVRAGLVRKMMVTIYFMLKNDESYRYCNDELFSKKIKALNNKSQAAA